MSHQRPIAIAVVALAALALPAQGADSFYVNLLRSGAGSWERGDVKAAAHELRIACFGLLEEPPLLAECLVRLAVAQQASQDLAGTTESFRRIAELEERFGAYTAAALPAELRQRFETTVIPAVPAATVRMTPSFRRLTASPTASASPSSTSVERVPPPAPAPSVAAPAAVPTPAEPRPATSSPATTAASMPPATAPARPAQSPPPTPAPASTAAAVPAPATGALTDADRAELARARSLAAAAKNTAELEQALAVVRAVAERHPGNHEAEYLAAEISYRGSSWREAVRHYRAGGEPDLTEPAHGFYYAIALYESGERDAARAVIERHLPRLERTPFVQSYLTRILGSATP